MAPFDAAREATAEIALPVLATTMSLVVIFIPVSFMSSISGRFLYQFGITAACAILVSLLVSFTLTPMMSARMFRRGSAATVGTTTRTRGTRLLRAMRRSRLHRRVLAVRAAQRARLVAVIAVAGDAVGDPALRRGPPGLPADRRGRSAVRDEHRRARRRERAAMDDAMRAIEARAEADPGIRTVLTTIAGGPFSTANEAQVFVAIAPHEERIFSLPRLVKGIVTLDPLEAFRGNYSQADVMQQIRGAHAEVHATCASASATCRRSTSAAATARSTSRSAVPSSTQLAQYAETLRAQSPELGIVDADTTLS